MKKKPTLKKFTEIADKCGGNISAIATMFKVRRGAIYEWMNEDKEFKDVIEDFRGKILDECIVTSRILARGVPILDQ